MSKNNTLVEHNENEKNLGSQINEIPLNNQNRDINNAQMLNDKSISNSDNIPVLEDTLISGKELISKKELISDNKPSSPDPLILDNDQEIMGPLVLGNNEKIVNPQIITKEQIIRILKIIYTNIKKIFTLKATKNQYTAPPKKRFLLYGVVSSVMLLILWAGLAKIDSMVRGIGQVVPSQRMQKIQNLEGGILEVIYVKEGQIIEKNQILVRLENETADSQYRDALARSLDARAAIARLEAEINGTEPQYAEDVLKNAPTLAMRHSELLKSRVLKNKSELHVLEAQKTAREHELNENKERLVQLNKSLKLAMEKIEVVQPLMASQAYSHLEFLALEENVQNLESEIATVTFAIPRLETAIMEAKSKLTLQISNSQSQNYNEIIQLQTELISLDELTTAGSDRVTRTEVRSPVHGIVQNISINTIGGVVKSGENIMTIIPSDDNLVIEAKIKPEDIAFIYPNQDAMVRLTAYDFSVYGGLKAKVVNISADTLEGKQGEIYYLVKVSTKSNHFEYKGKSLPILPGMMAQVDILTGKKSILEYVLKPILRIQNNALKER